MNTKVRKAINEFANRIKIDIGDEIDLMLVYGSALTDRYMEGMSDIDILIVSPKRDAYDKILDIQTDIGAKYGVAFSVLFESPSEVKEVLKAKSPFMKDVMKTWEILHEFTHSQPRSQQIPPHLSPSQASPNPCHSKISS